MTSTQQNPTSARSTSAGTTDWQALYTILTEDKKTTELLISALNHERDLLTSRNYESLSSALTDKSLLIQQLEKRSDDRQTFLQTAGFAAEKDLLAAAEREQPLVANAWRELAALWQRCQDQNQINDQIVRRTRIVIQRVLEIMHGQPDLGKTYNVKGESHKGYTGKAIASA